jgi:hypothetical protein
MRRHDQYVTFDTCGCRFNEWWDRDAPEAGTHFDHFERKCPAHAALTDAEAWQACWLDPDSEQHRKNGIYKELTVDHPERYPSIVEAVVEPQRVRDDFWGRDVIAVDPVTHTPVMETRYVVKNGDDRGYIWKFDDRRCLCLCIDGVWLTPPEKTRLQEFCDQTYGVARVRVLNPGER